MGERFESLPNIQEKGKNGIEVPRGIQQKGRGSQGKKSKAMKGQTF